jgi:hypothetical protein
MKRAFVREHLKVTPSAVRPLHLARHAIHAVRGVVHSELKRRFEGLRGRRIQRRSSGD